MKNTQLLMSCLFLMVFSLGKSQQDITTEKKNTFGFNLGYDRTYLKDINFSLLNFKGNGGVLDLDYIRVTKNNNLFYSTLGLGLTNMKTRSSDVFSALNVNTNLRVGYQKNIKLKNEKLKLYAGGGYHSYLNLLFFEGTEAVTFYGLHGLDLNGKMNYQLDSKNKFTANLSVPLTGVLVRPPHTGWDKFVAESPVIVVVFTGKLATLNKFFGVTGSLGYERNLSEKWNLTADYIFRYYGTSQIVKTTIVNSQLSIGASRKF